MWVPAGLKGVPVNVVLASPKGTLLAGSAGKECIDPRMKEQLGSPFRWSLVESGFSDGADSRGI